MCHLGMHRYEHNVGGVRLVCWLEFTPAQKRTDTDPAYPANADLCHAYHHGEDIYELLPEWLEDEIEEKFLEDREV